MILTPAALDRLLAQMAPADAQLVRETLDAPDVCTTAQLVVAYYRDLDRADRTPRPVLYLHMGLLSGVIAQLLTALTDRPGSC